MREMVLVLLILFLFYHVYGNFNDHYKMCLFVPCHQVNNSDYAFSRAGGTFVLSLSFLFSISFFFDQDIRDMTQNNIYSGSNFLTEFLHAVGDKEAVFYCFFSLQSANVVLNDNYFNETLFLALKSLFITQGITETFKHSFGRDRPRNSPDNPFRFRNNGDSFFSGHSSGAWAYLTVIAGRYERLRWYLYPIAGSVSLSRIYEDAHWTSDVILGAIVGYSVGRLVLFSDGKFASKVNILPYIHEREKFLLVQFRF